jgi:uncharacterized protein YggT (Ycf19 family)
MILFLLYQLLNIVEVLLLVRVILSWTQQERANGFTVWVCELFEPLLYPLRKFFSSTNIGIDFSPIVLFIGIGLLKQALVY